VIEEVEIQVKYEGYLKRQETLSLDFDRLENVKISE